MTAKQLINSMSLAVVLVCDKWNGRSSSEHQWIANVAGGAFPEDVCPECAKAGRWNRGRARPDYAQRVETLHKVVWLVDEGSLPDDEKKRLRALLERHLRVWPAVPDGDDDVKRDDEPGWDVAFSRTGVVVTQKLSPAQARELAERRVATREELDQDDDGPPKPARCGCPHRALVWNWTGLSCVQCGETIKDEG